jgi:hypothetical protein
MSTHIIIRQGLATFMAPRVSPAAIHIQPLQGCFFKYLQKLFGIRFG